MPIKEGYISELQALEVASSHYRRAHHRRLDGWRSHGETAEIVATFPKLADIAGLTDAEKKELLAARED